MKNTPPANLQNVVSLQPKKKTITLNEITLNEINLNEINLAL